MESRSFPEPAALVAEAKGLEYRYRDGTCALRGIDLGLRKGEVLGLLGPNGSGKSTLLRLTVSRARPTYGSLRLFPGETDLSWRAARRRVAAVFERPPFEESLDGRENALILSELRGSISGATVEAVDRWLARFGLDDEGGRPVGTYSLGMRQRLALTEAFSTEAALLLLDEPLLGLDLEARRTLARALSDLSDRGGAAIISLHDPGFASSVCHRVAFLHMGRLVGLGTPTSLVDGLGRDTLFEIETESESASPGGPPPQGLRLLGQEEGRLRVASDGGTDRLPLLAGWLSDAGLRVRSIRVREPDLEDVFFEMTGAPLERGVQS